MNRVRMASGICMATLALVAATPLQAAALAPHRAFYTLEPQRLDSSGTIVNLSGKLAYEITGSDCDGYAVSYRMANRYSQAEGDMQVSDTQLTSYETGDGTVLDMRQKQYVNAKLESEAQVLVKKATPTSVGDGALGGADGKTFKTDPAALFPTAFQKHLVDLAEAGTSRDDSVVFEGSDGDKAMRVISFIGAKHTQSKISAEADSETLKVLSTMPSWPVTISYYDVDAKGDDPPVYQASFNLLENGVSTDLVLDYGTYALKGTLSKIELLKPETCN